MGKKESTEERDDTDEDTMTEIFSEMAPNDMREIFMNMGEAVFVVNKDWKIVQYNTMAEELTGYHADEAIGMKMRDIFKTSVLTETMKDARKKETLIQGGTISFQNRDEETIHCDFYATPFRDSKGKVRGSIGFLRMVDKNRKMRDQYLEGIATPVIAIDANFNFTYINKSTEAIFGIKAEDCIGKKCYDYFKTNHCKTKDCALNQAMATRNAVTGQTISNAFEGKVMHIEYTGTPITNDRGEVVGAVEFINDVTNSVVALKFAQEKVNHLNSIPTPILAIDNEFRVTFMNPVGASLVGRSVNDVIGKKCYDLFKTEHCKTENCSCMKAMMGNGIVNSETVARPLGNDVPIRYTAVPIFDEDGEITGALEYIVDIADIKKMMNEQGDAKNYIESQVDNLLKVVSLAADGDLTVMGIKVNDDTIGRLVDGINLMILNLKNLVEDIENTGTLVASTSQEIASSAEEMNASAQEISSALQQISKGSQTQAEQVEQTAAVMKEMTISVGDVAKNANSAAASATSARDISEVGRKAVRDSIVKMQEIQKVVNDSAEIIGSLGKRSEEIGQIVDVITNISDQTNLLALNAAIEAARAGDQGRGFAVVAEEVKNLAEDSREAAERISQMIKQIRGETVSAVNAMEKGTREVSEGMISVNRTGEAFDNIAQITARTAIEIQEISKGSESQKAGTDMVAMAIDEIANIAEETSSATEESASSTEELTASMEEMTAQAQELSQMALSLQKYVSRFKVGTHTSLAPKIEHTHTKKSVPVRNKPLPQSMEKSLMKRGIKPPEE